MTMSYSSEINALKKLTNDELFLRAKEDVQKETQSTLQVLHTLREIERRRAFADKSYPSLFEFCVDYLNYKKGAAYRRILAMRALKDLPEIEEKIQSGALTLMTVAQAQGYFKTQAMKKAPLALDEKKEIIKSLENKSSRETEKFFLEVNPQEHSKEKLKPLDIDHYQWQLTLPVKVKEKLDRFRVLLGKEGNSAENVDVLEKALDLAIKEKERQIKITQAELIQQITPEKVNPAKIAIKKVPALGKMKRLWIRDGSQCTFVDPRTKTRCSRTRNLEIDHIKPRTLGGESPLENLRLLCKSHNQSAAIEIFGFSKMDKFINNRFNGQVK